MSGLIEAIQNFFRFLGRNKFRIFLIPVIAIAWIPFLFPYSDLRSVIATRVSTAMGDGFAIDFDHVALAAGSPIGLELQNFEFNGPGLPPLAADRLVAQPSLLAALTRSAAGSIEADGLFKGNVTASLESGKKMKVGNRQEIKTNLTGVQLAAVTDALRRAGIMGFTVQGTLDTTGTASIDPNFEEQPEADLVIQGKTISIPSVSVPIPNMGPVQTPSLQLGQVAFKGKMNDGKIQIEDFTFGQGKDSLTGRIRGELGLMVQKTDGQRVQANPGAFDLKIELTVSKALNDAMTKTGAGLALVFIEKFKKFSGDTLKYAFRVRSPAFGAPATFEEIGNGS